MTNLAPKPPLPSFSPTPSYLTPNPSITGLPRPRIPHRTQTNASTAKPTFPPTFLIHPLPPRAPSHAPNRPPLHHAISSRCLAGP
ncbi:hypothetical protein BS50DRAFT_571108 [Corynespora cassiicola Philippines]|uniref:Uncharacterized protein n=1 Tax=Corynespora cassiicola Philippines TaxID=1448308 RepID=A0A2T2NWM0_CORCC|nr:hypothetical protein BS50DRAFT_571108 [Corynespora cassiicola Philippines]